METLFIWCWCHQKSIKIMCHDLYTKGCWKFVIVCFHWKKKQVGFFVIFTIWVELNQKYLISRKTFRIFGTFFYYKCLFMCLIKGKNMIFVTLLLLSNIQDQKSSKHFAQLSSFIEFIHVLFSVSVFHWSAFYLTFTHIYNVMAASESSFEVQGYLACRQEQIEPLLFF